MSFPRFLCGQWRKSTLKHCRQSLTGWRCAWGGDEQHCYCSDGLFIWRLWGRPAVYLSGTQDLAQDRGTSSLYGLCCYCGLMEGQRWWLCCLQKQEFSTYNVEFCPLIWNNYWNKQFLSSTTKGWLGGSLAYLTHKHIAITQYTLI